MATSTTPLLGGFDFNFTSQAPAYPSLTSTPAPPPRPPTPDPRHTPRLQKPPPHLCHSPTCFAYTNDQNRIRRKPTAIYVGDEDLRPAAQHWRYASDAEPLFVPQYRSHPTLTSLLPLPPSTPSPRFATSPSLSSGTTVQSSPTLTPTTAFFDSSFSEEPQPSKLEPHSLDAYDNQEGKLNLKRAKRLPHREPDLWEVHAIVHVDAGGGKQEKHQQYSQHERSQQRHQQQHELAGLKDDVPLRRVTGTTTEQTDAPRATHTPPKRPSHRKTEPAGLYGIYSESARREGRLRKASDTDNSTYSLSKYHFPAPPGDYRVGLSGGLQHPTRVQYRGASFDLVNPHASLLLSPSHFENAEEVDGLLDDYIQDSDNMPRALYTDPATARRNIMGLDGTGETTGGTVTRSNESSETSLVPSRPDSDPFDLRGSDVPSEAADMFSYEEEGRDRFIPPPRGGESARSMMSAANTAISARQIGNVDNERDTSVPAPKQVVGNIEDSGNTAASPRQDAGYITGSDNIVLSPQKEVAGNNEGARDTVVSFPGQNARSFESEDNIIAGIVDEYDYTRDPPYQHEETLQALESGSLASHDEEIFSQLTPEVQQHMSEEFMERLSELPTSERTYGDTNQLLGIGQRQAGRLPSLQAFGDRQTEARIRPAPGRSDTQITVGSGPRSATGSVHSANSPLESSDTHVPERPQERARGDPLNKTVVRDVSGNTFISDEEGDWETTRSESHKNVFLGYPRPSQESYANTSFYSERNRLSGMSDAFPLPPRHLRSQRTGLTPRGLTTNTDQADFEKAKAALRVCKNRLPDQKTLGSPSGHPTVAGESQRATRGFLQGLSNRRPVDSAHGNDIELEELRQRNPQAVRHAAGVVYEEGVANREESMPSRSKTPLERLRSVLKLPSESSRTNNYGMKANEEDDQRNLLARTPTTEDRRSRLEFSGTANTFCTVQDSPLTIRHFPSLSEIEGRTGIDLNDRPPTPAMPTAVYTPEQRIGRRPHHNLESGSRNRGKAPVRPTRRAAMSSQTSLRALITGGSPTSNIQGAFTDREMIEASDRWNLFPHHHRGTKRYKGSFPHFDHAAIPNSNAENRMLVHPSEILHPSLLILQERLSKRYLMYMLPCPPLCFMYCSGYFDYLIARKTDGDVKVMSSRSKDDALLYGVLITICYIFITVGIAIAIVATHKR